MFNANYFFLQKRVNTMILLSFNRAVTLCVGSLMNFASLVSLLEIIRKMESIFNLTIIPHKPIFQMHSTKSNIIPPPFNVISIHNTSAKSRSATTKAQHYAITSVVQTPSCHYHNLYGKEKIMGKGTKWRGSARMNGPRVMKCDSPNDV